MKILFFLNFSKFFFRKYYLEDLHILAKEYMEGSKALLTKQQFGALFSNLETLIPIHEQLYKV